MVETCVSRERQGTQDTVVIKTRKYNMDSVKTHSIDIPLHRFIFHLFYSLIKGGLVGLLVFGVFAWLATGGDTYEVEFSASLAFIFIGSIIFIIRDWTSFQIPCDIAVKDRCKLEELRHSQVEAIPEIKWNEFVQSIGDRAELIERDVKTDYDRKKKCSYCGKQVHVSSKPGEHCPHCRMQWEKIEDRLF